MYFKMSNAENFTQHAKHMFFSAGHTVMRAALTISSVHEADINRVFVCVLSSPQIIKGESQQEIRIIKQEGNHALQKFGIQTSVLY